MTRLDDCGTRPASNEERPVYRGLNWTSNGKPPGLWIAESEATPITYVAEQIEEGLWSAREGFPAVPGRPYVEIGRYPDRIVAQTACERRDFAFWSAQARRAGLDPVFMGSPDHVSDFISSLADHERDDLLDMISGGYVLPEGTNFLHAASFFAASKNGLKQERNGNYTLALTIAPQDLPLWLMQVSPGANLVCGMTALSEKTDEDWAERATQALKRSFALARDSDFHAWLGAKYDRWGLVASAMRYTSEEVEEAVAETLRRLIGCPSRRDLATNRDAIMRLEKIDREFYLDLSRGFAPAA